MHAENAQRDQPHGGQAQTDDQQAATVQARDPAHPQGRGRAHGRPDEDQQGGGEQALAEPALERRRQDRGRSDDGDARDERPEGRRSESRDGEEGQLDHRLDGSPLGDHESREQQDPGRQQDDGRAPPAAPALHEPGEPGAEASREQDDAGDVHAPAGPADGLDQDDAAQHGQRDRGDRRGRIGGPPAGAVIEGHGEHAPEAGTGAHAGAQTAAARARGGPVGKA